MWKSVISRLRRESKGHDAGAAARAPIEELVQAPEPAAPPGELRVEEPEWVSLYRQWVVDSYGTIRILDMTETISLTDLYIPLTLSVPTESAPGGEVLQRRFLDIDDQARLDACWRRPAELSYPGPREALLEHRRVAVVGDPGAGKTTMLRNLAVRLAREQVESLPPFPIVIDLHQVGRASLSGLVPPEALLTSWAAHQIEAAIPSARGVERWLRDRLEAGAAVMLLDGLDEVAGATAGEEGPYRVVFKALTGLAASYPDVPMLVTCRRAHIGRFVTVPKGFQILETSDFEWEQVSRFLDVWFQHNPATGEALRTHLRRNVRVRGLAANPLLLALICITFQRRGSLPQRRADLYKRCVDVLLAEWDASRRKDRFPRFALEHKEDLLRRVAWHFHENGMRYIRRQDLLGITAAFLPMIRLRNSDAEPILDEITAHHGLLKDFGQGWYGFHHFTLQEHFAVEHITSWQRLDAALALRSRNWWREIIRLYAGKGDCTELICRLASEREDLFQSNLSLIAECLDEGSAVDPAILRHAVEELTRIARNQGKPTGSRVRATELAMRLLPEDDASQVTKWLTDDHVPLSGRLNVVRQMSHGLTREFRLALRELLSSPLDLGIREALATALAAEADTEELAALIERVPHEPDLSAQQRLATAIGAACADQANVLMPFIVDERIAPPIRLGLAASLSQSANLATGKTIATSLDEVADANVRTALMVSLFALGEGGLLDRVRVVPGDRSVDLSVRMCAAGVLAARDRGVAREALLDIVRDGTQERSLRVFAAHELAGIADDAMRLALMGLARDESVDRFVRTAVIEDIGESRSRQLTEPLLGLLSDPSALEYVRRAAADALGSLGDPQTVPHLVQLWRSEPAEQRLRARALLALGHIGTEPALREIIDVLASPSVDRNLRRALAEVLRPSGTSFDAEVLDRACGWLRQTDIPGAMLTVIARFSAEAGRDIFPEEAGLAPFTYRWAQDRSC